MQNLERMSAFASHVRRALSLPNSAFPATTSQKGNEMDGRICERCDTVRDGWRVTEARLEIGELFRKPHLCPDCTRTVQEALRAVLRPLGPAYSPVRSGPPPFIPVPR